MIKCNNGECEIKGHEALIEAQFIMICSCVKEALSEKYGEKRGKARYEQLLTVVEKDIEELRKENERMREENPLAAFLADVLVESYKRGDKEC